MKPKSLPIRGDEDVKWESLRLIGGTHPGVGKCRNTECHEMAKPTLTHPNPRCNVKAMMGSMYCSHHCQKTHLEITRAGAQERVRKYLEKKNNGT